MQLQNQTFLASTGASNAGQNILDSRLARHFGLLFLGDQSEDTLKYIYTCIMKEFLQVRSNSELKSVLKIGKMVNLVNQVYFKV
jgi:hypothetical protein